MSDVEQLRSQLRDRGYLTHGIERWFALDPWSSRAFWLELATVAGKAALLIAAFGSLAPTAVMVARNHPLTALEILALFASYAAVWLAAAALLAAPMAVWWSRFDNAAAPVELVAGIGLSVAFFLVATVVVSAALLSFSIYEVQRIPTLHRRPRTVPMSIAAIVSIALLFVPAVADRERTFLEPMVVTTPSTRRVALIAVDGLTWEILQSRPDLAKALPHAKPVQAVPGASTTERWASLGTGVPTEAHGVRAIEGIRFRGGTHVLQRVSRTDFILMDVAPAIGLARREPLPPTVRRRDYVWEIFAERGMPSVAVNWWATPDALDANGGALTSISPERIFTGAGNDPLNLDRIATERWLAALDHRNPRFATVYLPALDVILNRIALDPATQLAQSNRALDGIAQTIARARARGYTVVVIGIPGDGQRGSAVVASTIALPLQSAWQVAPTLLDLLGFPSSAEMPGAPVPAPIPSYGPRTTTAGSPALNEEYYEKLRSLGYIR